VRTALLAYIGGSLLPFIWIGARMWVLRHLPQSPGTAVVIPFGHRHSSAQRAIGSRVSKPLGNLFTAKERARMHGADTYLAEARMLRRSKFTDKV
jgi:hypothetical protein